MIRAHLITALTILSGILVFKFLNLPLPFLFGPMAACLIAALFGTKLQDFGPISVGARTILGVAVGASITPALIDQLPNMLASVLLIPIYVSLIAAIGIPYFYKICRFDFMTAYYSAMPGGLQDMVIFGEEAGGNPRILSLIHATRLMLVVILAPIVLVSLHGVSLSNPLGEPASTIPWNDLFLMVIAAILGWKVAEKIGLFGASILGPMIVATLFSLTGLIHYRPPEEAILTAQIFIGAGIGVHYVGITYREMASIIISGLGFALILFILAAIFAIFVGSMEWGQPLEALLAFSPGGQAEMTVLAIIVGADLSYVILHHLTRLVLVITGAPILASLLKANKKDRD